MEGRKRRTAWLLVLLMLFVTLVSGFGIACAAHHACVGADCSVCAHITRVRGLLRNVSAALILAFAAAAFRFLKAAVPKPMRGVSACSPVRLRVKLLN